VDSRVEAIKDWLFEALGNRVAEVYESMTGERPAVKWEPLTEAVPTDGLRWRQAFRGGPVREHAGLWVIAADADWAEAGKQVLVAAGIADGDDATLKSTYLETLGQALGGIAQDMGSRVGAEVVCLNGGESPGRANEGPWARLHMQFGAATADFLVGLEQGLLDHFLLEAPAGEEPPRLEAKAAAGSQFPAGSKTFELLLDVELPVSISFGRAQVPLKDVLKLTTGSIVELNRSIAEPVEIIVNNCVIARGEVVVVEGNFGVRIHEVISRQERLRTLS
jgi:flagellar motor switch protein FliN